MSFSLINEGAHEDTLGQQVIVILLERLFSIKIVLKFLSHES